MQQKWQISNAAHREAAFGEGGTVLRPLQLQPAAHEGHIPATRQLRCVFLRQCNANAQRSGCGAPR